MDFSNILYSIPAWLLPAAIAGVLFIAAVVVYIIGMAQGYSNQDYIDYRAERRRKRRKARQQQNRR